MKKLLLLFTTLLLISCSSDDGDDANKDKIIGTWELVEYNQTIFEDGISSAYRCLKLGSNDWVFRSDGTGIAYWIECEPLLDADNPTVNIDLEEILSGSKQEITLFQWENKNGGYYFKEVFDDGTLSPEVKLDMVFLDNDTKFKLLETEDMGELVYQKK